MTATFDWLAWPQTKRLVEAFGAAPGSLRFVGGCVRDGLLDRQVTDVDCATILAPNDVITLLQRADINVIPTGIDHGTVTAVIGAKPFEITTLRKDVATDGRHAQVAFTDDWKQDAARRDFTMNALYLTPQGELFDYFGGETDARSGVVKFIGDARARVQEDYLRILRFYRFSAHYGKAAPDAQALAACEHYAARIEGLSGERVQHELRKLLAAAHSHRVLAWMQQGGVLAYALGFPGGGVEAVAALEQAQTAIDPVQKLALLLLASAGKPDDALSALRKRLAMPNAMFDSLRQMLSHYDDVRADMAVAEQKKLLRKLGKYLYVSLLLLHQARETSASAYAPMLALAQQWQPPQFPLRGDDLLAAGLPAGKALGEELRRLETLWEASDYTLSKEALLAKL